MRLNREVFVNYNDQEMLGLDQLEREKKLEEGQLPDLPNMVPVQAMLIAITLDILVYHFIAILAFPY
ncbi:hypothetical protein V2J09_012055 [Rumex salicifolius]